MSQDGTYFFDTNQTGQAGYRILQVTNANPLPAAAPALDTGALINLASAGAGTFNSADQTNVNGRGAIVVANISAKSGTIAVTVNIQGKDIASGTYYTILSSASLTGTGQTVMTVYPGTTAATNTDANSPLPRTWRVQVVSGTGVTPSVTMTVGASLIP